MNTLASFYREREQALLGGGFILLLILIWQTVPTLISLPRGIALFFTQ